MGPEAEEERKRRGRKLQKRQKFRPLPPMQYPSALAPGDDAEKDFARVHTNQSVLSLITTAGSKTDFHSRFNDDSSGSDTEHEELRASESSQHTLSPPAARDAQTEPGTQSEQVREPSPSAGRQRSRSASRLRKSLPKLRMRSLREKSYMSQSQILPGEGLALPKGRVRLTTPRDAPFMSQILEAQARAKGEQAHEQDGETQKSEQSHSEDTPETPIVDLATRLKEIFGFENPEEVMSEYPCWLLQSVLLQGYMYITQHHICFYAYLPKRSNMIIKSGYLSKRGRQNPRYSRFWFTLKGDVLAYFDDPSNKYYQSGHIDLRYAISATLSDAKNKETKDFTVVTNRRTYYFTADSHVSAKEWVKALQKVIFRTRNDGDSVKICVPINNIIDIEESPVVDFADTLKIRVIDSDETYAVDEYFFSFFSFGKDAIEVLRALIDDTEAQKVAEDLLAPLPSGQERTSSPMPRIPRSPSTASGAASPQLSEHVRATLSPTSQPISRGSPRMGGDWSRPSIDHTRKSFEASRELIRKSSDYRKSFDISGRRSASTSRMGYPPTRRDRSPSSKNQTTSTESFVHSMDPSAGSSTPNQFNFAEGGSASQILSRSDVFKSPTITQYVGDQGRRDASPGSMPMHPIATRAQKHAQLSPEEDDPDSSGVELEKSASSNALQHLYRAGTYPLKGVKGLAGYLQKRSKKMSGLLATDPMGYVEKVSGMWAGGKRHYGDNDIPHPESQESLDEETKELDEGRFRAHFGFPDSERLQATYFGWLHRVLPIYGKVYLSDQYFCFRGLLPATRIKLILPIKDIENVDKGPAYRPGYYGLVIVIKAMEEIFFDFRPVDIRDDCAITLLRGMDTVRFMQQAGLGGEVEDAGAEAAKHEHKMLQQARMKTNADHEAKMPKSADASTDSHQIIFDDPRASIINFKPVHALRITCLTIGSRGDVQPYIALCKGLLAEGHKPTIATHREFQGWVEKHGITFAPVEGDPAELMRICVEYGMFTYSFLKEASSKFRGWIDELLSSAWKACQNTDILIESPSAMAGIHIAEALAIPYFRAFTMPWTRTRAYPHAFAVPEHKMGGYYNYISYVMFDNVFWAAIAGQVNRWRKKELGLRSTNLDKLHTNKVPFLYNFSPAVVIPPLDYSDWIRVTGYWFLDEGQNWNPPPELVAFIKKARKDEKKLVYIGFGSIVVADPAALTKTVVESVLKADVRCILSKGWSDRLGHKDSTKPEVPLPPEIHQIASAPHDWLFKHMDAATHHGGAGTTGASLRAGIPTIVKPFFGDQFFFGSRVEDLGVGICMRKLNVSVFSRALWEATRNERMVTKAKVLGETIRKEDGVNTAIQAIYRDLEYAKSLIKRRDATQENEAGEEESWTFIGDESQGQAQEADLSRRAAEWGPMLQQSLEQRATEKAKEADEARRLSRPQSERPIPSRSNSERGRISMDFLKWRYSDDRAH